MQILNVELKFSEHRRNNIKKTKTNFFWAIASQIGLLNVSFLLSYICFAIAMWSENFSFVVYSKRTSIGSSRAMTATAAANKYQMWTFLHLLPQRAKSRWLFVALNWIFHVSPNIAHKMWCACSVSAKHIFTWPPGFYRVSVVRSKEIREHSKILTVTENGPILQPTTMTSIQRF